MNTKNYKLEGGENVNVFQIRMKVYLLKDIPLENLQTQITKFIDSGFAKDETMIKFHQANQYKNYTYDLLYPQEVDQLYKKGEIYTLSIRTVSVELAKFFSEICVNNYTEYIKGLTVEGRILPQKHIDIIYTLTPVIIKTEDKKYWRDTLTVSEFEKRLKNNLIKKWNQIQQKKIEDDVELYTSIEFRNKGPIGVPYKGITLLGDKIKLNIANDPMSQQLAYMSLGTGLCEMNARGMGFANYRWL